MTTTPSLAQMLCRANSGHYTALAALAADQPILGATAAPSAYRGMTTVATTLRGWGCLDGWTVTDRGRELLEALEARRAARPRFGG